MSDFLTAAHRVLADVGRPLSAREITEFAIAGKLLITDGKTPWQTMKARLSTDIVERRGRSRFMRTGRGLYALRAWADRVQEFHSPRFKRGLFDEDIVVFPAASLGKYIPAAGRLVKRFDTAALLRECYPMRRREAEDDTSVIQLVSFFVVRYRDQYLTYKRSKRLPEGRLHGAYSVGFGGHLNPDDVPPLFNIFIPSQGRPFLLRELDEELVLPRTPPPQMEYRGVLYDDSRPVSRQHIAVVYEVCLNTPAFAIGERGFLIDAKFETISEIQRRFPEFENWSQKIMHAEASKRRRRG